MQDTSLEIAVRAIIHHHQTTMNNVTPITHLIIHCTATPEGRDVTLKDTRTAAQRQSLSTLVKGLHRLFPQARIVGHHDLNPNKACPCFNVSRLLTE